MFRALALLMIAVLLFSHGRASTASPHVATAVSDHGHDHFGDVADYDGHATDEEQTDDVDLDMTHVHMAADAVPSSDQIAAPVPMRGLRALSLPITPLARMLTSPLLEPPAA